MNDYVSRLHAAIRAKRTPSLVGLDPRWDQLPQEIRHRGEQGASSRWEATARAYEEFSRRIIDVVAPLVPAVKPQAAFFEECGPAGMTALGRVVRHAREAGLIVICDAKRGDIGSTAEAYARAYLAGVDPDASPWGADALTVSPYLGADTLEPFVTAASERGAGIYVLVRTSNPGSGTFQNRITDGRTLSQEVASTVQTLADRTRGSNAYGCIGAVVGATYPQELAELRAAMPAAPLLVPGYGSQGGTSANAAAAFAADGLGAVVNSSRGILFAYLREPYASRFGEPQWEQAVEAAVRDMIADLATNTPAGRLRE